MPQFHNNSGRYLDSLIEEYEEKTIYREWLDETQAIRALWHTAVLIYEQAASNEVDLYLAHLRDVALGVVPASRIDLTFRSAWRRVASHGNR